MNNNEQTNAKVSKITIGITSLAVILALGVWGYIAVSSSATLSGLATNTLARVVSIFSGNTEVLEVRASTSDVASGENVIISYEHIAPSSDDGIYAIAIGCRNGISFDLNIDEIYKNDDSALQCGSYYRSKDTATFSVEINSENSSVTEVPVYISYFNNEEIVVRGSVTLSVSPVVSEQTEQQTTEIQPEVPNTTTVPVVSTPNAQSQNNSNLVQSGEKTESITQIPVETVTAPRIVPNGTPDLTPVLLDIGILDKTTNEYTATTTYSRADRIGIRFEVINNGTARANNWYFSAILPTYPEYIYTSSTQEALNPGEKIEFTIGFDQVTAGEKSVTINIDPGKQIMNDNHDNNRLVVPLFTQN